MRGAIMASGARPRSAVELFIERLVPFEQRPPARLIVQSYEIHRGALSPFVLLGALPIPFVSFGCLREERIKKLLSCSLVPHHSAASMCSTHSNAAVAASWTSASCYILLPNPREGAVPSTGRVRAPP